MHEKTEPQRRGDFSRTLAARGHAERKSERKIIRFLTFWREVASENEIDTMKKRQVERRSRGRRAVSTQETSGNIL